MRKRGCTIILLFLFPFFLFSQKEEARIDELSSQLESLIERGVDLNQPITISLNGSIQDLVTFLGESTGINISIDSKINKNVATSFTQAPVKDIILYLCDTHDLDLRFSGSIIQLISYETPEEIPLAKELVINYQDDTKLLTISLNQDTLSKVTKRISELTGQNIAVAPEVRNILVDGFVNNADVETALRQLAINNNLEFEEDENFYLLKNSPTTTSDKTTTKLEKNPQLNTQGLSVRKSGSNRVNINALNVPIVDLIRETALKLNTNYYLLPDQGSAGTTSDNRRSGSRSTNNKKSPESNDNIVSIQVQNATFEEVLEKVCGNSDYTFSEDNDVFVIGKRTAEGLRETKVIQLQYRSAEGVLDFIPEEISTSVEIDTLLELNSLILSGSQKNIAEIDTFIRSIDKVVPVVMIELIIVDVQNNKLSEFGVEAGVKPGGKEAGGAVISGDGYDFTFSPGAINRVLDLLSGRNIINLGQVTDNFYLSLKAVEEQGIIDIQSTPKLATLNSHDAVLSIGEKRYYLEQQVNFPGTDRPIPVQSNRFQEVEANLDILITPIVSGNDQVTLNIYFEQSEFIGEPELNQPPPQVSRKFESMIRVKDGEMVVLGGLERELKSKVRRGIPWLSRIPLIGWMFGRKKKNKSKNKLMIFVQPTIIK